jgi:hypothetical protein
LLRLAKSAAREMLIEKLIKQIMNASCSIDEASEMSGNRGVGKLKRTQKLDIRTTIFVFKIWIEKKTTHPVGMFFKMTILNLESKLNK